MKNPTAAFLVIGDEILNGRTKDKNINSIALFLQDLGIDLCEVRIVQDEEDKIISAVNALRKAYTYLFTSGGIGPTHDDITAESIANAFSLNISEDPRALALLRERYTEEDLTPARRRMARIPEGAMLIENPVSKAPGFIVDNVFVMAGVPQIFEAMLNGLAPNLQGGKKVEVITIDSPLPEGVFGESLSNIAEKYPNLKIGSYPAFLKEGGYRVHIQLRGHEQNSLKNAQNDVLEMLELLQKGK